MFIPISLETLLYAAPGVDFWQHIETISEQLGARYNVQVAGTVGSGPFARTTAGTRTSELWPE